jgi:hypothetical protein
MLASAEVPFWSPIRGQSVRWVAVASLPGRTVKWHSPWVPALLVTAPDSELPAMLRSVFPGVAFATPEQFRAIIKVKPGSLVVVLDGLDAALVAGLVRSDVRAVALVTPQRVPMMFRRPIVITIERPLVAATLVAAIKLAMGELAPSAK